MKRDPGTRFIRKSVAVAMVGLLVASLAVGSGGMAIAQTPRVGGKVIFRMVAGPDWIDPGQTYYTFGYVITYATNRPLYSSSPEQPDVPVPDLADGDPVISPDNKTVTVSIKSGIRYAPPVNREVTSHDVKYAIERAFTKNVSNLYVYTYFDDIVGAPSEAGSFTDIPGIETPDDQTIIFHLESPTAPALAAALIMPVTVPVPKEYAEPFDQEKPSSYDTHVAFTGPYMIRNDAEGNLVGLGDDIEIVRNPNWDPATDYRPAYLDEITFKPGRDVTRMATQTFNGSHLLCCDASPVDVVNEFRSRYPDQIGSAPGHGTRWVSFNTTIRPLTNLNIRKALAAWMDRKTLRAARGGSTAGSIAQHFLPPGLPGFEESGGYAGFTDLDYMSYPEGNRALAKRYMLRARQEGLPITRRGRYTGSKTLLMVGTDSEPGVAVARSVKRQVEELGFKIDLRLVPPDRMFTRWCGVSAAKVAICPNVGWFFDFFDPQSLLQPTFDGDAILPQGNNNWSLLDRPEINAAMDEASTLVPGSERWNAWAQINRKISEQAPGIPLLWDTVYQVESSDVVGVMNPYFSGWDLSFTSLKD
ncbi:MAG: peptide/nickel transport system substrate-binding protein [Actinomycetota bacterium]|nr:peptide/nickel transport system substrate-binding protein [Actinomycetota bacterium]